VKYQVRAQPEIRCIRISGYELRVALWHGKPESVPLLIFNGIGSRLELLGPFVQMLDPDRKVIVFDVPGTGESPVPRLPYRLWMLARLTSQLLDVLGHERVHIMGVSWGGAIAQQFAVQRSARCAKLVLAATATGMLMVPGNLLTLARMATPRRFTDRSYLRTHFGSPPLHRPLPNEAVNAPQQQTASAEIPIASDAPLRHISRGFLIWGFFCQGVRQSGKSFVLRQFLCSISKPVSSSRPAVH
jgi:pimeloyl-ACP methyl ester carboxylesterase